MGFMGDYYAGPSPFAAALQQATTGFFDAYGKMKGIGLQEEKLADEKARTALQQKELEEQARYRTEQLGLEQQRIKQAEVGLEQTRAQTAALTEAANRRKAADQIMKAMPTIGEYGEAISYKDQMAMTADQLAKAGLFDEANRYRQSAQEAAKMELETRQMEDMAKFRQAQMGYYEEQTAHEKATREKMAKEEAGYRSAVEKLAPFLQKHGFPKMEPDTPFPVIKEMFDFTQRIEAVRLADRKTKDDIVQNTRAELSKLYDLRAKYTIADTTMMGAPQVAALKEAAAENERQIARFEALMDVALEGRGEKFGEAYRGKKPVEPAEPEPIYRPETAFPLEESPAQFQPSRFRPRSRTGGMLSGINDMFRSYSKNPNR